ncbi:uncharacterized protein DNG_02931 [Cephalotrichum gorgonifer]|uniref:WD40 domain-containing protein n=1 Tax=Cephalotrichum gorgonifer TaxID=2041049 RepID=A0AAE8MTB5_9PEZI|nr:uncharacterized protein DNG_02931 [Cephalotrichum gorgonifer]
MASPPPQTPEEARDDRPPPRLLASANPTTSRPGDTPDLFRTVQFSADGTTLLGSTWNHYLTSYVLPQDLLSPDSAPHHLSPQGTVHLHSPIRSLAPSPLFSLSDPSSQTALVATNDHPIQLHHLFPYSPDTSRIASYKLINASTEAYITPTSLLWPSPGSIFLCGSANRLDVFDVSREGEEGHYTTLQTTARPSSGRVHGWKGTISALAASPPDAGPSSVLAAGSWNRWVGLYDYLRTPAPISHWSLAGVVDPSSGTEIPGSGVVQTIWSPCGRYLAINERNSHGVVLYDIRGGHKLLGVLGPRDAGTQMRLACDVFATGADASERGQFELWGGTLDGSVKVWENAGVSPGREDSRRSWEWKAHEAPVTNTALHPSGSVVVTSAGTFGSPSDSVVDSMVGRLNGDGVAEMPMTHVTPDTSFKIWECAA